MSLLEVGAGAVGLEIRRLGQANCAEMTLNGGAAVYLLDFTGNLRQEMHARVTTGLSSVEIRVPYATPTRLFAESFLGSLEVGDGFSKKDDAYQNEPALQGKSPLLVVTTALALGTLRVRQMR